MKRFALVTVCALLLAACGGAAAPATSTPTPVVVSGDVITVPGGSVTRISVQELNAMLASKDFTLVNVHIPYQGEIEPTDLFIPYDKVPQNLAQLPDRFARIVVYCRTGDMSDRAARKLVSLGYKDIYDVDGGMVAWEAAGYPLVEKPQ
ncbi:MAG: rhodanese-like domain-containing protein [Anaerolineae bacterium]